jgi:hypothetical protein
MSPHCDDGRLVDADEIARGAADDVIEIAEHASRGGAREPRSASEAC